MPMKVEIVSITAPRKASTLANVKVRLHFEEGHIVDVDDLRVLRNKHEELWLAPPTYSVPEGRGYRYERTVEFSRELTRQVNDAALDPYRVWEANHAKTAVQS